MSETITEAVRAARNLREIVRLYGELGSQIIADGISRDIADSNALNYLGPIARDRDWQAAYDAAQAEAEAREETFYDYAQDQLGAQHPLGVLAYWDEVIRDELDQPTGLRATVSRCADYLRGRAEWIFGETADGVNFIGAEAFGSDLSDCRRALEDVVKDGVRLHLTGTPCNGDECNGARLIKVYREAAAHDLYRCSDRDCEREFNRDEYTQLRKMHMSSLRAGDAWIDIPAAAKSIERSEFTIRQWMKFTTKYPGPVPRVRWRRVGTMRSIEVRWSDVRDQDAAAIRRAVKRRIA